MNKIVIGIVLLLCVLAVVGGGVYYYSSKQAGPANKMVEITVTPTPLADSSVDARMPAPGASGVPEMIVNDGGGASGTSELETAIVEVEAFEFGFKEDEIIVEAGQKVSLTIKNTGKMMHDFVVEGTDVRTNIINAGESDTIEFVIDEPGEYTFYCSVGKHRAQGMEGTLIVE